MDLMYRRRAMLLVPNRLPPEYQEVEYIKTNGVAYMDSGIKPDDYTKVHTRWYNEGGAFLATGVSYVNPNKVMFAQSGYPPSVSCLVNNIEVRPSTDGVEWERTTDGQMYDITIEKEGDTAFYTIIDETNERTFSTSFFCGLMGTAASSLLIFAIRTDRRASRPNQLYSYTIWKSGEMVRDFVPCYRIADEEVGLYDIVSQSFFRALGGELFKGPDV